MTYEKWCVYMMLSEFVDDNDIRTKLGNFESIKQKGVPFSGPMVLPFIVSHSNIKNDSYMSRHVMCHNAAWSFLRVAKGFWEIANRVLAENMAGNAELANGHCNECVYPFLYLCRHSVELLLKSVLYYQRTCELDEIYGHNVKKLWSMVEQSNVPSDWRDGIKQFVNEIFECDPNGEHFRYNFERDGKPVPVISYRVDLDKMLHNTEIMFAVFRVYIFKFNAR